MKFPQFLFYPILWWPVLSFAEHTQTPEHLEKAIFAGGCFWCTEAAFDNQQGVLSATSGYIGGEELSPDYKQVSSGKTGHYEAIEILYNPAQVSYEKLLDIYWTTIDPTDAGGQFYDRGSQYKTAIFYLNDEQKKIANESKEKMQKKIGKTIVTEIKPAGTFYRAEEYHQDYHKKNPFDYDRYKEASQREQKLRDIWD